MMSEAVSERRPSPCEAKSLTLDYLLCFHTKLGYDLIM